MIGENEGACVLLYVYEQASIFLDEMTLKSGVTV